MIIEYARKNYLKSILEIFMNFYFVSPSKKNFNKENKKEKEKQQYVES